MQPKPKLKGRKLLSKKNGLQKWEPEQDSRGLLKRSEDQTKINTDQIDRDFDSLSHTKLWYAREKASASARLKKAELHLDNVKKRVKGRAQQALISRGTPRSTDQNLVNLALVENEDYLQAQQDYIQALQDYEDAKAAWEGVADKKDLIIQIGADRRRQ